MAEQGSPSSFDPEAFLAEALNTKIVGEYCLFDNLPALESHLKRIDFDIENNRLEKIVHKNKKKDGPAQGTSSRNFLPHQEMIKVAPKISKHKQNVILAMDKVKGPLTMLLKCVNEKTRIKVTIRKNHGIRGFVTGYVQLFDKYWNLVLTDVEEHYQRRKFRFCTKMALDNNSTEEAMKRFAKLGISPPEQLHTRSTDRKRVEIVRRIPLVVIRGEQIGMIIKLKT